MKNIITSAVIYEENGIEITVKLPKDMALSDQAIIDLTGMIKMQRHHWAYFLDPSLPIPPFCKPVCRR